MRLGAFRLNLRKTWVDYKSSRITITGVGSRFCVTTVRWISGSRDPRRTNVATSYRCLANDTGMKRAVVRVNGTLRGEISTALTHDTTRGAPTRTTLAHRASLHRRARFKRNGRFGLLRTGYAPPTPVLGLSFDESSSSVHVTDTHSSRLNRVGESHGLGLLSVNR